MPTHLPLGDIATRLQDTPFPGHRCFEDFTSRQLGLNRPTPPMSATLNRATNTNDAGSPQTSGAYHFDSRSSTHLQSPRINASQPTRSKPYCTNLREEEDPTWPFASSQAVYNSGVKCSRTNLRKKTPCGIQNYKRCLPQPVACTNRLNTLHKRTG